jgi:hypothetical protein
VGETPFLQSDKSMRMYTASADHSVHTEDFQGSGVGARAATEGERARREREEAVSHRHAEGSRGLVGHRTSSRSDFQAES